MEPVRSDTTSREPAKARRRSVALIVETSVVYGRQILHGTARYRKTHAGWSVFLGEQQR
jgi:hypothetical protein